MKIFFLQNSEDDIVISSWQLLYVGSLLDYCSLTGFCSPSYSFASLPC